MSYLSQKSLLPTKQFNCINYNIDFFIDDIPSNSFSQTLMKNIENVISEKMPQLLRKLPYYSDVHLKKIEDIATGIRRKFSTLVVIGMGGAILNSKDIINYITNKKDVEIIFLHRLCNREISNLVNVLNLSESDLSETAFLFISNSGNTVEIAALAQYWYEKLNVLGYRDLSERFIYSYADRNSLLGKMHLKTGGIYLEYDKQMGGRFSTFISHNILILQIAGQNIAEWFEGGNETLQSFFDATSIQQSIFFSAAIIANALRSSQNSPNHLSIFNGSYDVSYNSFIRWYNTALAETLGKMNFNIMPTALDLPVDQHGVLQAILNNKNMQYFSLFELDVKQALYPVLNIMKDNMLKKLKIAGIPTRVFKVQNTSLKTVGAMMMHMILETITAAVMLDIEPFSQPQIDELKYDIMQDYKTLLP